MSDDLKCISANIEPILLNGVTYLLNSVGFFLLPRAASNQPTRETKKKNRLYANKAVFHLLATAAHLFGMDHKSQMWAWYLVLISISCHKLA